MDADCFCAELDEETAEAKITSDDLLPQFNTRAIWSLR
jgi:hypothetical protein